MITLYWFVLALIALAIEAATTQFVLIFVAVGAILAAGASALGLSLWLQFVVLAVTSITLPLVLRDPLLRRYAGRGVPTRAEGLLGLTAAVTETIDPLRHTGRVTVAGQDWMAKSDTRIEAGRLSRIVGSDGIALLVEPMPAGSLPAT